MFQSSRELVESEVLCITMPCVIDISGILCIRMLLCWLLMRGVIWKFRIFGSFDPIHTATFGLLGVYPLFHDAREIHPLHEIHEQPERHESQGTAGKT